MENTTIKKINKTERVVKKYSKIYSNICNYFKIERDNDRIYVFHFSKS